MTFPNRNRFRTARAIAAAACLGLGSVAPAVALSAEPAGVEFFEKKIRPLLADNCYNCHSASTNAKGGLRVDDRNGLVYGGNNGPAVVPGEPDKSLLIQAVAHTHARIQMPPKKQLTAEQVADLRKWVRDGAAWPEVSVPASVTSGATSAKYERLKKEHWAWQPLREAKAPEVRDAAWARDEVDRFVLAKLEEKSLKPVGDAEKRTLIRRATFDLTGLPPTPDEIAAFELDSSPDAFAKVVDRLLASPAFGERWGRHWLDVARYAESTGSSRNVPFPHAWRYRDYVIDSFNKDKPFDQFLREQVAGDLLPADTQERRDEQRVATGFLALGVKDVNQRFKVRFIMDNVDEQIDTVSRSVLATTVSCARCHDHKFDPVSQSDYYALAGIFTSTDLCAGVRNKMGGGGLDYYDPSMLLLLGEPPKETAQQDDPKVEQLRKDVEQAKADFEAIRGTPEGMAKGPDGRPKQRGLRMKAEKLQKELMKLTDPIERGQPAALGVRDAKVIADTQLRVRGEAEQVGPTVPRGFPALLQLPDQPKVNPQQSGRLELAQWLTSTGNPLTPRVAVNRVWHNLFGRGLVSTVDNFGVTGDRPSHPELLDYLAGRFVREGWSVKKLVREIVLTRTYQLSSDDSPAASAVDPAGVLLWRHSPRRLSAEEIRDATLAAAGTLDPAPPKGSPAQELPFTEQRNNGPEAARFADRARESVKRSVYLPLLRGWTPRALEMFDFAEQGMVTGSRDATTVSPQALYLLNDPFVRSQAQAFARRVLGRSEADDAERVDWAYRFALGRHATAVEKGRALEFIAAYQADANGAVAAAGASPEKAQLERAVVAASGGEGAKADKSAEPVNPDEIVFTDETAKEEGPALPSDPKLAAWSGLCQALIGSAEFRYVR